MRLLQQTDLDALWPEADVCLGVHPPGDATCVCHARDRFEQQSTDSSNSRWMKQQARAFLDYAGEQGLACEILTRDHDGAFSKAFDQVFKNHAVQVKPVGPRAPNLNAFIERWIQSLKQEALDHFLVFGKTHFDYIVSEYVAYYHACRPHQGIGNVLLPLPRAKPDDEEDDVVPLDPSEIKCERRLGGILKHYYREAA